MPQLYNRPIFEHHDDEQQQDPSNTLERSVSHLGDPYEVISKALLDHKLVTFPKMTSYGNPFLETYYSYH